MGADPHGRTGSTSQIEPGSMSENEPGSMGLVQLANFRQVSIQPSRILNDIDHVDASTWFDMVADRDRAGAANTRHSMETTRIVEGANNNDMRKNFFSQRVPRYWNSWPATTRQQTTVLGFKAAYDGTTVSQPGMP